MLWGAVELRSDGRPESEELIAPRIHGQLPDGGVDQHEL